LTRHAAPLLGLLALVLIFDVSSYFDSYLVLQLPRHLRYEYLAVKTAIVVLLIFLTWKYIPTGDRSAPALFSSGAKHPDPLLTLRAFACLLVLMGHFFGVVFYAAGATAFAMPMLSFLVSSPWGGLWVFFTLSGYLIGKGFFGARYPINPQGVARFYVNRVLRIYPVYVVAILLVIAIREPEMLTRYNFWMVWQILLLDYNSHLPINPIAALWSVSTEFQFYLLSPFLAAGLFWLCKTRRSALCALVGLLALGAASRYAVLIPVFTKYHGEGWLTNVYAPMFGNIDLFLSVT
jgi:peptidoglycan/LPS O-acetylase OafA/YrhL